MGMRQTVKTFFFYMMVFLCCGNISADESETPVSLEQQVEGLWLYTGLITSAGKDLPLNGIFLFKDGVFAQYSVFSGEPIEDQGSMAHAGPYSVGDEFVHLMAEQTFSTTPLESPALNSRGLTEHDVAVSRSGKDLSLVFSKGTGTIQNFERAGSGSGDVYVLENGVLALVDGYFILIDGNEDGFDAGYGTYEKDQDSLKLNINRWTEADEEGAPNLNDTSLNATFDGQTLRLEDGRRYKVSP
jgi:hypothetical protein